MVCLLSFTLSGGEIEYLETVSSTSTTWTKDPNLAIHFLSEQLVPISTVILRFPIFVPLKETAPESEKNLRRSIVEWFQKNGKLLPSELSYLISTLPQ